MYSFFINLIIMLIVIHHVYLLSICECIISVYLITISIITFSYGLSKLQRLLASRRLAHVTYLTDV